MEDPTSHYMEATERQRAEDLPEETKLRASLAGARCARDEAMAERDRLRDALKLVYFHLGPPQPRLDDPADIPALVEPCGTTSSAPRTRP